MTTQELIQDVAVALGYQDSAGYVDGAPADPGARAFIWSDLHQKCGVDAAYFKGAVPVVAFASTGSRSDALHTQRRLWNYGRVPVLIAATTTEVFALSCNTSGTAKNPDAAVLERAQAGQELATVLADFTRFSIESGRLTERHGQQLDKRNRVDQVLLRNLQHLRTRLLRAGVEETRIEPLLGRSIFVRYLEDRGILRSEDLAELDQPESFMSTLERGWDAVASFFGVMSDHFNGDVFRRGAISDSVSQEALDVLRDFFLATDLETGQQSLWRYDFSIIPPELISSIYEQLLVTTQKTDAAYYTPRHVVDLVLDELLPPDWSAAGTRAILDPACGSGIFLTEAFRRIVYRYTAVRRQRANFDELSELLVNSIFGIDRSADAIGVTAFGLYLALLEHVDPRTVWLTARLPSLIGSNLVVSDFFDDNSLTSRKFDAIAGNPPWQSKLSPSAERYLQDAEHTVPDRQVAVAFVWRAVELLRDHGSVGFVLPSKTILHNRMGTADRFRLRFFSKLCVRTIIDLSPLRKELFGAASNPAAIAIFGSGDTHPSDETLLHASPRRTPVGQIVDGIAIPQQNIRRIPASVARADPSIWKPLLWGGSADVSLVQHLRESFVSLREMADKNGWSNGPGFQIVKHGDENDASHLADLPRLATKHLHGMQLPTELLPPVTDGTMHRPRKLEIYLAPHIIMRKGFKAFPESAFVPYDATFTDGLFAIAADSSDKRQLQAIAAILNSSVGRYWFMMTGSSWGVEREQLHHREWMTVPVPFLTEMQVTTLSEIVIDAANGAAEASWRSRLDAAVEEAYGLTQMERQVVSDALTIRLSELRSGWRSHAYAPPESAHFGDYATALREHLDRLEVGDWQVGLTERSHGFAVVTCRHREYSESDDQEDRFFSVQQLLSDRAYEQDAWLSTATIVEPEAVVLDGNAVHLVKPDRLSCWLLSSSSADAAEVFGALVTGDVVDHRA